MYLLDQTQYKHAKSHNFSPIFLFAKEMTMRMDQHCGYCGCCYQFPKEWHHTQLHQQHLPELQYILVGYCSPRMSPLKKLNSRHRLVIVEEWEKLNCHLLLLTTGLNAVQFLDQFHDDAIRRMYPEIWMNLCDTWRWWFYPTHLQLIFHSVNQIVGLFKTIFCTWH